MNKLLDWLVICAVGALVILAEVTEAMGGGFEPLSLAAGIALILLVRVIHHHAPRFIAAKYGRKADAPRRVPAAPDPDCV
jgi:hypothetical protein